MKQAYDLVKAGISKACRDSKRTPADINLIAVSKFQPNSAIEELYQYGHRAFGENRVQELCQKYEELPKDIDWYMIGHLQRNKVSQIIDKVVMIQSVDSIRLAETISKEAVKRSLCMDILLEVNIANEPSKFGFLPEEIYAALHSIAALPGIHVRGLMTIAPFVANEEENRLYFRKMYQLYVDSNNKNIDNVDMSVLSMGMTGDYRVAIEEGATTIRVGTGIFGSR